MLVLKNNSIYCDSRQRKDKTRTLKHILQLEKCLRIDITRFGTRRQ